MYKIRLYVVPEQEEIPEHEDLEELDLAPATMQRRNSRRPGAVRVNVIQKERRSQEKISPKIRQLRQEIEKPARSHHQLKTVELKSPRKREQTNDEESKIELESNESGKENDLDDFSCVDKNVKKPTTNENDLVRMNRLPPPVPFRVSSLPQKSVFASPRIRQLALNLQEKMLERDCTNNENENSVVCDEIATSVKMKNSNKLSKNGVVRSSTSATRLQRFDRERNSLTRSSSSGSKRFARECSVRKSGRKEQIQGGRSPRVVRVKDDVDGTRNEIKVTANSVILRRNNKLNGYRVSL